MAAEFKESNILKYSDTVPWLINIHKTVYRIQSFEIIWEESERLGVSC